MPATKFDLDVDPGPDPSGQELYLPSPRMNRLIRSVIHHPDLDVRLWASMCVLINLDVGGAPYDDPEDVAIGVVSLVLNGADYQDHLNEGLQPITDDSGAVVDVEYGDEYNDDIRAAALLAIMKSPDVKARELALTDLIDATTNGTGAAVEISSRALLRLAGWLANDNLTHH